jgi:hypothetical protein
MNHPSSLLLTKVQYYFQKKKLNHDWKAIARPPENSCAITANQGQEPRTYAKKLYMVLQAPNLPSSLKTCTKNKSEICTNKQEVRLEP